MVNSISSKVALSATPIGLLNALLYTFFLQFLTGIPKPSYLKEINAVDVLRVFSSEIFSYPFWLQDLSHFPLFFLYAWLWLRYIGPINLRKMWVRKNFIILTICLGYSVLNELTQFFIPMRFPSIGDLAMNLFGAMSAIFTHTWYCSKVIAADQLNSMP